MYVDSNYYFNTFRGNKLGAENVDEALQTASDLIDTLTFNRISSLEGLTAFQRGIVQKVNCYLAEWTAENKDLLESPYSSYSINGVSVSVNSSAGIQQVCGVSIPKHLYRELCKTGLCYRGLWR